MSIEQLRDRLKQFDALDMKIDSSQGYVQYIGAKEINKDFNVSSIEIQCDSDEEWNTKIDKLTKEYKARCVYK